MAKVVRTKIEAKAALDCFFNDYQSVEKEGYSYTLIGSRSFKMGQRKARKGRNSQTGEESKIIRFASIYFSLPSKHGVRTSSYHLGIPFLPPFLSPVR
ncbi:MAG: HU family DNA-binding protein [Deltaproteobacteria bacterium]|nr:HU family DNA-binding protein [Deltaproteobacteria bacterium]